MSIPYSVSGIGANMGRYQPYHYRKRDGCREEMAAGGDDHVNEQLRRSGAGKVEGDMAIQMSNKEEDEQWQQQAGM